MPENITAAAQNVRKRVLWPLGITLVVFLVLFIAIFKIYLQRELGRSLDAHVSFVAKLYNSYLDERSATLRSLIGQIKKEPALAAAMRREDRKTLLELSSPIFRELHEEQNITHIYFHLPDGVNLLRTHMPDRFGDPIGRVTMKQARSSGLPSSGAELGPLGTFTLRVVVPWFVDDELIGYIELGEEVEPLIERVAAQSDSQIVVLVKKTFLKQDLWQAGMEMLGRTTGWDYLPGYVATATTDDQLLHELPSLLEPGHLSGAKRIAITHLQQRYRGHYLPLVDVGGREVGRMMVLKNINGTLNDHNLSIALITVFCILLGGALFISAFTILGRTESALDLARTKLINEIEKTRQANIQLGLEVTERKVAEDALKKARDELEQRVADRTAQLEQQKKLLENLVSTIPSHVAWKNRDRTYIGGNVGYARLAGTTEDEIAGKVDADLDWSPSFKRLLSAIDDEVLGDDRPVIARELLDESARGDVYYLCSAVPLHNEGGNVFGMVSILQDITEHKSREQLLEQTLVEARQSNDRMRGIMRSVDDALLVIDAQDRILMLNDSAGALLRLNPADVVGKKAATAIWLTPLRDRVMEILRKREGGVAFDFDVSDAGAGVSMVMQARSSVLVDPQGRYEGMIFLARDVTRDRSMDRLKSEFISIAAHELRTPLATILGFSELLLDGDLPSDSDRQEFIRTIFEKADALSRLLDDMLDISRIESGRGLELFPEKLAVSDLFMPTIRHYQKRDPSRRLDVNLEFPDLVLEADPDKIGQVMENLLSNAVKYAPGNAPIDISGRVTVDGYCLTVSDKGIGMTPEQMTHAFDKFYRGDNTDKAIKGTGLGLTIVRHIIEEHQGKVWLESRPGNGTDVNFILPIS